MSNRSTKCLFYMCMTSAGTDMHCQMTSDVTINEVRKYSVIDYFRVLLLLVLLLL